MSIIHGFFFDILSDTIYFNTKLIKHNGQKMAFEIKITDMQVAASYRIFTKQFETPFGDIIPGKIKLLKFIGMTERGAVSMEKIQFLEVEREDGKRHLISVETIEAIEPI